MLGFQPMHSDPWRLLALTRLEGPALARDGIQQSVKLLRQLLSLPMQLASPADARSQAALVDFRTQEAETACLQDLPTVVADRERLGLDSRTWPWRREAEMAFAEYLAKQRVGPV